MQGESEDQMSVPRGSRSSRPSRHSQQPESEYYDPANWYRPQLNWDFADQSQFADPRGPWSQVQLLAIQERQLIHDLLNSFLGFRGYYIVPSALTDPKSERKFTICPKVNPQLRIVVEAILPLSSFYSKIVRFIQDNVDLKAGRVNQTLSGYLDDEMQDFYQMVTDMEERLAKGNFTLAAMWSEVQGHMKKLSILHQIVNCVGDSRGGATLTALHESITITMADESARQIFNHATKEASVPFFETLSKWINCGVIDDPYNEFMIAEKIKRKSPSDWDRIFVVNLEYVPSFLEQVVDSILSAGKYLDAIRKSLSNLEEMPSAPRQIMEYNFPDQSYLSTIQSGYKFANYELLKRLVVDRDIIVRLTTYKVCFTLEYGDLFNNIMENCSVELRRPVDQMCQSYLPSLIDLSIQTSAMTSLKYIEDLTVHLEKQPLHAMVSSLSLLTKSEYDLTLSGFDALTMKTVNQWPDCLLMHERALKCYQMLFRHLFRLRFVYFQMSQTHFRPMNTNQCMMKHYSLTFLFNCLSFMTQVTIQRNWMEFVKQAQSANSVEELRNSHDEFLYKTLSTCMLTSCELYTKFKHTLDICLAFADDLDENLAINFYEAVSDLIAATYKVNMPGQKSFIALIQPTYDYAAASSLSSATSHIDTSTEDFSDS